MFTIGLTILCAVFVIGYIFFAVAGEQEVAAHDAQMPEDIQDAADAA